MVRVDCCKELLAGFFDLLLNLSAEPVPHANEWPSENCSRANLTPERLLWAEPGCEFHTSRGRCRWEHAKLERLADPPLDGAVGREALDVVVVWYSGMRRCDCAGQQGDRNERCRDAHVGAMVLLRCYVSSG